MCCIFVLNKVKYCKSISQEEIMKSVCLSLTIVLIIASSGYAAVIRVPGNQLTIQAGIDAASDGDTVLVSNGTYTGEGNKDLDFWGKAITVMSKNGPSNCIIDCEGEGIGCFFASGETEESVLSGFTIRDGSWIIGGGIFCYESSPTIMNNIIEGNSFGFDGGGIFCIDSYAIIINNIIFGNSTDGWGGGIYCDSSSPIIINNTIFGNSADEGGGIYCYNSSPTITNTILWNNGPDEIYLNGSSVTVTYSDIRGSWEGEGNINSEPLLVDPDNGEYYLQVESPCLSSASCADAPETDIDGRRRPLGSWCDMGAYEQFDGGALPVEMVALTAATSTDGVMIKWRTISEINNLGFNIYRSDAKNGRYVKVNPRLIAGTGTDATPHDYSFTDETVILGEIYYYYIEDLDFSGKTNKSHVISTTVGKQSVNQITNIKTYSILPTFALLQNYPNPFNPETWIPFKLAEGAIVTISIYDTKGQLIRTIALGHQSAGVYVTKDRAAYWDGCDSLGRKVASGVYFYTLHAGAFRAAKRMSIVK